MLKTSAISALGKMKAKEAVPHLKKILKDGLSQWGEKDAFSPTRHYIGQVVYALASIEADKSIEIVRPLLESDDKNLQEIAISVIGNLDTPESFEFLKGKLMDANVNIADKAGVYINSHRGDDRKQLLIEAINERRKQGLSPLPETAWILCCIPGKDGLELALQFLEAEEPKYRRAAAKALGSRFEAIEALKKQLEKEKDKTVISTIKQSLRNLNVVLD
jgi:HEAT repeat protein